MDSREEMATRVLVDSAESPDPVGTIRPRISDSAPMVTVLDSNPGALSRKREEEGPPLRDRTADFRLIQLIGRGGQGEVWEALDTELDRVVAVKRSLGEGESRADFLKESFTAARLDHPNIVPVHGIGMIDAEGRTSPMLAMKRIEGRTWRALLDEDGAGRGLRDDRALQKHLSILIQVLNAVAYAHSRGVIHRDLKPQQVMVGEYGEVYLLDWGLAVCLDDAESMRVVHDDRRRVFTLDTASNPAGTPAYMAPEQTRLGTDGLGKHTDVFLAGAILHELLTGGPPYRTDCLRESVEKARRCEREPIPGDAPAELAALAARCMETEPALRPSAVEAAGALKDFLSGANRRAEARRIVDEVAAEPMPGNYENLSIVSERLLQSANLWPENPAIAAQRERVVAAWVEAALARRHLLLAQLQIARLHSPERREALGEELEKARAEMEADLAPSPLLTPGRIAAVLAAWVLVVGAVYAVVHQASASLLEEVHDKVESLAALGAAQADARALRDVMESGEMYSGEFQRVFGQLNFQRQANADVRRIGIVAAPSAEGGPWTVVVDADPVDLDMNGNGRIDVDERGRPPGHALLDPPSALLQAYREHRPASERRADAAGAWMSGFAPIMDRSTRRPFAVLGVDVRVDRVEAKLRNVRMAGWVAGAALWATATASLAAFFSSRRSLARARSLEEAIRRQNEEVRIGGLSLG